MPRHLQFTLRSSPIQREPSLNVIVPSVAGWSYDSDEMAPPSVRFGVLGVALAGFRLGTEAQ